MAKVSSANRLVASVDLGTSSLKAGLFDLAGRCVRFARVPYPSYRWADAAEQHAADWWDALVSAMRTLVDEATRRAIEVVVVGGHGPSPVFVDLAGTPVCAVQTWLDARADADRAALLKRPGVDSLDPQARILVAFAARALWLRRHSPAKFARVAGILHSGDFLILRMTERRVWTGRRVSDVFAAAGLREELLPEREYAPGAIAGVMSRNCASTLGIAAGVPVVCGGLDSFLGAIGSGMRTPGDACLNTGSSSVVSVLAPPNRRGRFEWCGYPMLSRPALGAAELGPALARSDAHEASLLLSAAARHDADAVPRQQIAVAMQTLADDRLATAPLDTVAAGLGQALALRCRLDAIFLRQRTVLRELEAEAGPVVRLRSMGRIVLNDDVAQLQADIIGCPIDVQSAPGGSVLGGALLGIGVIAADAVGRVSTAAASRRLQPAPARMASYAQIGAGCASKALH